MIVRMKRVTIVIKSSWLDDVLNTIGEIGVVHLQPVTPTENNTIAELKEKIQLMGKAVSIIPEKFVKDSPPSFNEEDGFILAKQLLGFNEEVKHLKEEIGMLEIECERLKVWGRFDPEEINKLKDAGILIRLFRCHKKELSKIPEKLNINIISGDKSNIYFAVISKEKDLNIPLEEIEVPISGMDEIESTIKEKSAHLQHKQNEMSNLYDKSPSIGRDLIKYRGALDYEEAKAGMGREDEISYLQGFCPESATENIREMAGKKGWAVLIEEPLHDDPVPTLLKHSRWTRIFQPVMNFIGVTPGYREFDTNGIFLIFFSIFFAMIIGDGGYGAVFLVATYIAGRFYKNISREKIILFYLLSTTTIIWGGVTGMWFGVESISRLPVLNGLVIPSLYSYTQESESNIIRLCFLIGAIQLSLARIWAAVGLYPSLTALSQTGWAALVWGIYFIVRFLLLNEELSIFTFFLVGYWVGMLILFEGQRGDGFVKGLFRGMINLPISAVTGIGCLSDLISYIRLFAIGLATREVAIAFNNMAGDIGFSEIKSIIIAICILIFGHTINILLGAMSVLVHGIRLNLLEFSNHLNIQWSGITYRPFKIQRS
jgi:V/A-type H+-transporting ATPase subunit I